MKNGTSSWVSTARSRSIPARLICSLPLHLITDASLRDTMFAAVQPGTPYTCGIDKLPDGQTLSGMFRAFYEASGLYTVTTSDKGFFTLVPRGGAQELMFQFDEQDTNGQFMITVPQAAEPQPSTSAVVTYGSDDPVSLSESDAAALSTVLLQANYKKDRQDGGLPVQRRSGRPDLRGRARLEGQHVERLCAL